MFVDLVSRADRVLPSRNRTLLFLPVGEDLSHFFDLRVGCIALLLGNVGVFGVGGFQLAGKGLEGLLGRVVGVGEIVIELVTSGDGVDVWFYAFDFLLV